MACRHRDHTAEHTKLDWADARREDLLLGAATGTNNYPGTGGRVLHPRRIKRYFAR
jgi:hypothetical protein